MKSSRFFSLLLCLGLILGSLNPMSAQAPQSFSYQAVARDASGVMLVNQNVSFRFSIVQSTPGGDVVYQETHVVSTDQFGIAHLNVGTGNVEDGSFSTIDWGAGPYFVRVEFDPAGGAAYQLMGTTQLLSVPYALHAGSSDLPNTGVSAGSYGSASNVGTFTVDAKGRLTAASNSAISIDATQVSSGILSAARIPDLDAGKITTGTLPISRGGTGAITESAARINLGATTVGGNLFTLTNPSAISFLRINADNSVSSLNAADFRTAIGAGTSSISGAGTTNYITKWTTGGSVLGNSSIYDNGNVGIGMNTPHELLTVEGPVSLAFHAFDPTVVPGYGAIRAAGDKLYYFDGTTSFDLTQDRGIYTGSGTIPNLTEVTLTNSVNFDSGTFFIDGTNNRVGIGTASPLSKLTIEQGANNEPGITVRDISNTSGGAGLINVIGRRGDTNSSGAFSGTLALSHNRTGGAHSNTFQGISGRILFGGNHTDGSEGNVLYPASIAGIAEGTYSNSTTMPTGIGFYTGSTGVATGTPNVYAGTERMRITNTGSVGIGTSTPNKKLHLQAGDEDVQILSLNTHSLSARYPGFTATNFHSGAGGYPLFELRSSGGTLSAPLASQNSDILGYITGRGFGTTDFQLAADIRFAAEGNFTNASSPGAIQFSTTPTGFNVSQVRMTINQAGNVGIGTYPAEKLDVDGRVRIRSIDNAAGNFLTVSGTGVLQQRSPAQVLSDIGAGTGTVTGTGLNEQIAFWTSANAISGSNNFTWNGYQLNITPTAQTSNTLIRGGNTTMTGNNNTVLGSGSLANNTTGLSNVAIGVTTLLSNTEGSNNLAIGNGALRGNTTGNLNTAIGVNSLYTNSTGNFNIAMGFVSLNKNETGSHNIGLGANAIENLTSGDNNIAIGREVGRNFGVAFDALTQTSNSVFIGYDARPGGNNQTNQIVIGNLGRGLGSNTTRIGNSSTTQTHLDGSVSIGSTSTPTQSLHVTGGARITSLNSGVNGAIVNSNSTGVLGITNFSGQATDVLRGDGTFGAVPGGSGWSITGNSGTLDGTNFIGTTDNIPFNIRVNNQRAGRITSAGHTAFGYQAANSNTIGTNYVAIGYQAMSNNTIGNNNLAIGHQALQSNVARSLSIAIGNNALLNADNRATGSDAHNIAIGYEALRGSFTPASNTGDRNIAIGSSSMRDNTSGNRNIVIGHNGMRGNTTGVYNTAMGESVLFSNTTGDRNTAIGAEVLWANSTGGYNTGLGGYAMYSNTTGSYNVALGYEAGRYIGTGLVSNTLSNNSVFLGYDARPNDISQTNQVVIGYQGRGLGSNTTRIGNSSTTWTHLDGRVSIGSTTAPTSRLVVTGVGTTSATSALNIQNSTPASLLYVRDDGNVGIGTTDPMAKLHINGSLSRNAPVTKTGNFTLADTENWIIVDNNTSNTTVTLPVASTWTGREVSLKNLSATRTVISASSNVVPIDGTTAGTAILPAIAGSWALLVSDGTNWVIMQQRPLSAGEQTYSIGYNASLGGYVVHVTPNGKHGLVVAMQDQTTTDTDWYVANNAVNDPANHDDDGKEFTDWRLPTLRELDIIYPLRASIGGFQSAVYWTRSYFALGNAPATSNKNFSNGLTTNDTMGTSLSRRVRAVRSF